MPFADQGTWRTHLLNWKNNNQFFFILLNLRKSVIHDKILKEDT